MYRHLLRLASFQALRNFSIKYSKYKNISASKICNFSLSGFFGLTRVYAKNTELIENFEDEIKRATVEGEKYLAQLMRVLRTLILQTSVEYQECLIKQIEMTEENTKIGPVGEHWDNLTGFRVKGNELKEELVKYETLAASIADIVHREVQSSLAIGNQIILDQLNGELVKLQKLCHEQLEEIHRYEKLLLAANRSSIIHGVRSN